MLTKGDDGFTVDIVEHRDDLWAFTVDGEYVAVRRERDYGSGPGRYLWSAWEVEDHSEGVVRAVRSLGSFHHSARVLNGSLAGVVLALVRSIERGE